MKILYVNTLGTWGGVATYLHALIKNQVKQGNEVYLLTGSKGHLTKSIKKEFPSVICLLLPTLDRNIHIFDTLKAIFQFRKIIKNIKPDIIHLNCIMSGIVGRLGSIGINTKIIYNAHGWDFEPRVSKKIRILAIIIEKLLAYLTDKIICVSDYEYKIANKYHIFKNSSQGIVIKNGSANNLNKISDINPSNKYFSITMAARFESPKDQMLLIKSFYTLLKTFTFNKDIYLYLLGNGPTFDKCRNEVNKLDLNKYIIFTGELSNLEVLKYYRKSNIIVLITKSEAISLSLIEAMSVKRPIIASNVGGIPELINHNGIIVNNNVNDISYSIFKLLNNLKLMRKMSSNSYNIYTKYYTQNLMVHKTNELYNEVLKI